MGPAIQPEIALNWPSATSSASLRSGWSTGWQVEQTHNRLLRGNPWELARPEVAVKVKLGDHAKMLSEDEVNGDLLQ